MKLKNLVMKLTRILEYYWYRTCCVVGLEHTLRNAVTRLKHTDKTESDRGKRFKCDPFLVLLSILLSILLCILTTPSTLCILLSITTIQLGFGPGNTVHAVSNRDDTGLQHSDKTESVRGKRFKYAPDS